MKKVLKKVGSLMVSEGMGKAIGRGLLFAYFTSMVTNPAVAQSIRDTGISIFTIIYGAVGVLSALVLLFHGINWKTGGMLGGNGDPKKSFIQAAIATGFTLSVVAIVQAIKTWVNTGVSISNL